MVLLKIFGGLIFILGLWIVIGFPFFGSGSTGFQSPKMSKAGILIGAFLMLTGFLMAYFLN